MEKSVLRQRARDLRKNSTDAEKHLRYYLRASRLGFKFKRQVPIGEYIIDFVCLENRNEMLVQRKEALTKWSEYLENLIEDNVVPILIKQVAI